MGDEIYGLVLIYYLCDLSRREESFEEETRSQMQLIRYHIESELGYRHCCKQLSGASDINLPGAEARHARTVGGGIWL